MDKVKLKAPEGEGHWRIREDDKTRTLTVEWISDTRIDEQ